MRHLTEKEFLISIKNKNGDFQKVIFDFPVDLTIFEKINFKLDFKKSIFSKNVNFNNTIITREINFSKCVFLERVNFLKTVFEKNIILNKSKFYKHVNFNLANFISDVDFNQAIFHSQVSFKKTKFNKSLFFNKTFFYKKVDFSYAYFSNNYITSFLSINRTYTPKSKNIGPPYFIFRYIHFSNKVNFTDTSLGRTIFQDSNIENITFKDCDFPKLDKRNSFYTENPKIVSLKINGCLEDLSSRKINTIILRNIPKLSDLNIGDRILAKTEDDEEIFFIVARFDSETQEKMIDLLGSLNKNKSYSNFEELICRNCFTDEKHSVVAFQIKKFDEKKHWNVLEDSYRQIKKALEESHDWQGAGGFYKGEIVAKINNLKINKEKFFYRTTLFIYKQISCFGESVKRILFVLIFSLLISTLVLYIFKPNLLFFDILEKNIKFFIPIFGETSSNLKELSLKNWQNIIILMEIMWFYLLWLILAITIRRRFRR